MTLGLITFLLILYFWIINSKPQKPEKLFIVIATIVMILLSGLRHEGVGNDTLATMLKFEETINASWNEVFSNFWERYRNPDVYIGKDPGEMIFYKTLSLFTGDSRVFLFVVATIVLVSFGYFVYRSTHSIRTILFSYIFYISITYGYIPNSSFRQSIAMAILMPAFVILNKKKYIIFVLLLLLASVFHKSVLTSIIVLPLMFVKNSKQLYWFSLLPFLFVFFNYQIVGYLLGGFSDIYEGYLGINYYARHNLPIMVILMVLGLYLYIGVSLRSKEIIERDKLYLYGSCLTLILVPLIRLDPSALRLISYFGVLMGIQVGNSCIKTEQMRTLYWVIVFIFWTKSALLPDDGYRFMWQEKKLHERYGMLNAPNKCNDKERTYTINMYLEQTNKA